MMDTYIQSPPARHKRKTKQLVLPFGQHVEKGHSYIFDSHKATNAHMAFAGPSGSGKSHQLNRIILSLAEQGAQVHCVSLHGDLGDFSDIAPFREAPIPPGLVHAIDFGEQSRYGLPPLDLLPNTGPRKRSNSFIDLLQRQGALGPKQKSALFRLLMGLYEHHGFQQDNPETWTLDYDPRPKQARNVVARENMIALPGLDWFSKSQSEKDYLKKTYSLSFNGQGATKFWEVAADHPLAQDAQERWGVSDAKRFPTLSDVRRHLWDRYVMMKSGQSNKAIRALDKVMALAAKRSRLRTRKMTDALQEEIGKIDGQLEKAQEETLDAMKEGMANIDSGNELEELLMWDSPDAIKGLFDRIESLERSGIFQGVPPRFAPDVPVWLYNITTLSDPEQVLFVDVLLEHIFSQAKARGEADGPDTFILIDEAHKFVVDDSDHIINRIVLEARKFGIGIIFASQSFLHFSDDLMTSSSLKIVLGCPVTQREQMRRKLGLDMLDVKGNKVNPISLIRQKSTAMISIEVAGESRPMELIDIVAA